MQLFEAGPDKKQRRTDFPWGGGSSRMGASSPSMPKKQAVPRVVVAFISLSRCQLFYGAAGLAVYPRECQGADVPLALVGVERPESVRTGEERVTPQEKRL